MKRKMLLVLAGLLIVSMLVISPVLAEDDVIYRANGKLEQYADAWSSEIVNGRWNVEINETDFDLTVKFFAFYRELNIDEAIENSPAGTIDTFKLTLVNYDSVEIIDDACTISGATIHFGKKWWNLATGKPERVGWEFFDREITIDESGILIDLEPTLGQNFDISGPTLSIHY